MNFDENRSWMYNRLFERLGLRKEFVEGVERFTLKAKLLPEYMREGKIKCPCVKCKCSHIQHIDTVKLHLYKKGFMPNYFVWTAHGECYPNVDEVNNQNWVESQGSVVEECNPKPTPEEEAAMFIEAAGGYTSKNRAYGIGSSRYKDPSRIGIVNAYASSSSCGPENVDPVVQAQFDEMEKRLVQLENERKEMEKKLADQAEKMAKFEVWFSSFGPGKGHGSDSHGME